MKNNVLLDVIVLAAGGALAYFVWEALSKSQGAVQNVLPPPVITSTMPLPITGVTLQL